MSWTAATLLTLSLAVAPAAASPAPPAEPIPAEPIPAGPIPRGEILRLSPAMEEFLAANVGTGGPAGARLSSLMDALFERGKLDVSYSNERTTTAARTFEQRGGNCLSFTLMFAAMARHVGLEVRFREVGEVLSWDRRGDVLLNNKHLYAEVPTGHEVIAVDFIPGADKRYRQPALVDEDRVIAHFYSNLGAEHLAAGEPRQALVELRQAIAVDESFGWAWSNLGVALRQLGRPEEAEQAYLKAYRLDPSDATPLSNLASLYAGEGKVRKAARLERKVDKHRRRNPFYHYRLALQASAAGKADEAIGHLRRAVRRAPDDPRFRTLLAELYHGEGRRKKAEKNLELALVYSSDPEARERLEAQLAEWRSGR